jgi:hypothetical protein
LTTTTKTVKVATKLEHELLAAAVVGAISPSVIEPKELSKIGRIVHAGIIQLIQQGLNVPIRLSTLFTHCISNLGAPESETKDFLRTIHTLTKSRDTTVLLKVAKEKETLVNILNEASKQLGNGTVELRKFNELVDKQKEGLEPVKSLAEIHQDYRGEPTEGYNIRSLPSISSCTSGVQGVWIIGGEPGVGKSTLSLQVAIEVQTEAPVIYYDLDGTGEQWMCYRVTQAVGKERFQDATNNLYYRSSISSLDSDLLSVPAPALLVIDSIQTLPLHILHRRSTLDQWLTTFKSIANKGYTVLLISEMNRNAYGDVKISSYKESGGIEYAGSMCAQLHETEGGMLEFHCVKNRHGPKKGHIATLVRNDQYPFWMEEV